MTTITPNENPNELEIKPNGIEITNTTIGKSVAWLLLIAVIFYGAAFGYAIYLAAEMAIAQPELASSNPELFGEQVGTYSSKKFYPLKAYLSSALFSLYC